VTKVLTSCPRLLKQEDPTDGAVRSLQQARPDFFYIKLHPGLYTSLPVEAVLTVQWTDDKGMSEFVVFRSDIRRYLYLFLP